MRIGIIGPKASCEIIEKNLRHIDRSLEVRCYVKEQAAECGEVIEDCERECDAILFTGQAVEGYIKRHCTVDKPATSVSRSIISVAGAFIEMQKQGLELDSFSVDIVEPQVIEDILDGFNIMARNIYSYPVPEDIEESNYLHWHKALHDEGKTNVALTSFQWVARQLREQSYPVIYLGPTRAMTRLALERLKNDLAFNRAEHAQIAAEIISLSNVGALEENYYSGMLEKTEIDQEIIRYTRELQAAMFQMGRWEYIIFANAGVLRDKRSTRALLQLQQRIQTRGVRLDAGIGMGGTAYRAEINAKKALSYALSKSGRTGIYWIDENDELYGPLGRGNEMRYQLISSDPQVQEIAEKTGLSSASVLRLKAIIETRRSDVFDAHELADCLEVTTRSAHRVINRILEAGYGEIHAKDNTAARGRPKALIRICF